MTAVTAQPVELPFAMTRPIHVASVALKARSVPTLAGYYRDLLGLETIAERNGAVTLGAGGVPLIELLPMPANGLADDPRSAGLFHTAFLMPARTDLARWILMASEKQLRVDGMSDHLVSEAIYLTDPEGNGIEIYADRPPETWQWDGPALKMATEPLDIRAIVAAAGPDVRPLAAAPAGLRIGHVHLRVGNPSVAEAWWKSEVGLERMAEYPGATFLASGGYHHHIAGNAWRSRGAGPRDPNRSGLAYLTLTGSGVAGERELVDPWGTVVRLTPGS